MVADLLNGAERMILKAFENVVAISAAPRCSVLLVARQTPTEELSVLADLLRHELFLATRTPGLRDSGTPGPVYQLPSCPQQLGNP